MKRKVFLSYSRIDEAAVRKLFGELSRAGFEPWMDKEMAPGTEWNPAIEQAIREADFFLACLSTKAISRAGVFHREISAALDVQKEKPEGEIYLIPVRLEPCPIPQRLRPFHWSDFYEDGEIGRLIRTLGNSKKVRPELADPQFSEYAGETLATYRSWEELRHYVELTCRVKGSGDRNTYLTSYVLDKWLPDQSKDLLAVLGEFGSGKTLFCYKLASDLLVGYQDGRILPVVVKLRDLKLDASDAFDKRRASFREMLVEQLATKLGISNLSWPRLEEMLRSRRILLMLDGFEEIMIEAGRFQMSNNFRAIRSTVVPGSKVILTCRTHYFSSEREEQVLLTNPKPDEVESLILDESLPDKVSVVYIEQLDDKGVRFYLRSKFDDWEDLYDKIKDPRFYDLKDLARRPIFLDVIVASMPGLVSLQEKVTRARLYQQYADLCFKRESEKIAIGVDEQYRVVEELAFAVYQKRLSYFDNILLADIASVSLRGSSFDAEGYMRRCPFFRRIEAGDAKLDFIHQSFFEFFVASKIHRAVKNREKQIYGEEYLISPVDGYLVELLDADGELETVARWLEKDDDVNVRMNCAVTLGRSGQRRFLPILQECLTSEKDIGVAGRIADALASLGDRESLAVFLSSIGEKYDYPKQEPKKSRGHRLLYDIVGPYEDVDDDVIAGLVENLEHHNTRIRKFTVFLLGRTRSPACMPGLVRFLENPGETIRARRYAAAALGLVGRSLARSASAGGAAARKIRQRALSVLNEIASGSADDHLRQECLKAIEEIDVR